MRYLGKIGAVFCVGVTKITCLSATTSSSSTLSYLCIFYHSKITVIFCPSREYQRSLHRQWVSLTEDLAAFAHKWGLTHDHFFIIPSIKLIYWVYIWALKRCFTKANMGRIPIKRCQFTCTVPPLALITQAQQMFIMVSANTPYIQMPTNRSKCRRY